MRKYTKESFIEKAISVHGNKYNYSKIEYKNCDTKVCIICPEHGEFWQTPYKHINEKNGCPKCCKKNRKYSTEEFIIKAKEIHENKYDYSKVEYKDAFSKVCIICPEHGEFFQSPSGHLQGRGCPKCKGKNKTTSDFINELIKIHGDKYDYLNVHYNGAFEPVRIICKKHGEFISTPHDLLKGCGCPECGKEKASNKLKLTTEEFINRAIQIHGKKYDYSKVEYKNAKTPVRIICHKHGDFFVSPNKHTSITKRGCPKCSESILETEIRVFCENNGIKYIQQKTFSWLGLQRLDFYLPDYNIAVECQGYYHFEPHYTSTEENANNNLLSQIKRDELKKELCDENCISILYYVPINLQKKIKISNIYRKNNVFNKTEDLLSILQSLKIN